MKITSLDIYNYRSLCDVKINNFDNNVNLFVGVNGAGKSSILDAMSLVLSWYIARIRSAKGRGSNIPTDDISKHSRGGCSITLTIDNSQKWKLFRTISYKKSDKSDLNDLNAYVLSLREKMDEQEAISLPIIAYYDVRRIVPNVYPRLPRTKIEYSELDTYNNALSAGQLFNDFFTWFRLTEDYENEQVRENNCYSDRGLSAVRRAMSAMFPEYSEIKVMRKPLSLILKKGAEVFKVNQLSDGEKCYISLVCDIARRLATANPTNDPLQGEGIVMIDEVDLHLHPKWQQSVISKLRTTFPNIQFFITTHSPIVASDVNGKVFAIKEGNVTEEHTYGMLSSNILSSVFDLSSARSLYVQSLFDNAYDAIKKENAISYNKYLQELIRILGPDDQDITGLKIEQIRYSKLQKR